MADLDARLIQRQLIIVVLLGAIAVAAFLGTRAFAAETENIRRHDAATWFAQGQQALRNGDARAAVDRLRKAVTRDPGATEYSFGLATALEAANDVEAAEQLLISLRERAPEDPDINLHLAHLEVRRGDAMAARRYYESALNALWQPEQLSRRHAIRLELIRFLLNHGEKSRALSELLTLSATVAPEDLATELQAAGLFLDAGDPAHASEFYKRALKSDPGNNAATAGLGRAAFESGDYATARRYLHDVGQPGSDIDAMRRVADGVVTGDPLGPRLGMAERRRRLAAAIDRASHQAGACAAASSNTGALEAWTTRLSKRRPIDTSDIEEAVDLVYHTEQAAGQCGALQPEDRALVIIGRRHAAGAQ